MHALDNEKRKLDLEMRERLDHLKQLENELEGKADQLRQKEKELNRSSKKGKIAKSIDFDRKDRLDQELQEKEALLDQFNKQIAEAKKDLEKKGKHTLKESDALKEEWNQLHKKEKELQTSEDIIIKKETLLHELEKHLLAKEDGLKHQEIGVLEEEKDAELEEERVKKLETLLNQKEEELLEHETRFKSHLEEKNVEIAKLNQEIMERQDALDYLSKETESVENKVETNADKILHQDQLLVDAEKSIKAREGQLKQKEHELNDILIQLEQKHAALESFQATQQERERELLEKESALRNQYGLQKMDLAKLHEEIDEKQQLLRQLTDEEQAMGSKVEENSKLLEKKELEIIQRVRDLEEDQQLLDRKENELKRTVMDLEKDKDTLEMRETEVLDAIDHLEKDKRFREVQRRVEADKIFIKEKEREVLKLVKKLEKDKEKIDRGLINQRTFDQKMAKLQQKEEDMVARETALIERMHTYGQIEVLGPSATASDDSQRRPMPSKSYTQAITRIVFADDRKQLKVDKKGKQKDTKVPLSEMMTYTRGFIRAKDFNSAKKTLNHIQREFRKIKKVDVKRKYQYDIMELKTQLDLALLEA